jgi:hypothetical protein
MRKKKDEGNEFKIDELATMKAAMDKMLENQERYFTLLKRTQEFSKYIQVVPEHIMDMNINDQILLLEATDILGKLCKHLTEKYEFMEVEEEEEEE